MTLCRGLCLRRACAAWTTLLAATVTQLSLQPAAGHWQGAITSSCAGPFVDSPPPQLTLPRRDGRLGLRTALAMEPDAVLRMPTAQLAVVAAPAAVQGNIDDVVSGVPELAAAWKRV